jgi:hypothetical protein
VSPAQLLTFVFFAALPTQVNSKLLECMRSVVTKGQVAYGYQHRVLMTGTPLQNNTVELWSLMNFIEPAKFPDLEKFTQKYGSITTQEQVGVCCDVCWYYCIASHLDTVRLSKSVF